MHHTPLGRTGLQVTALGYGAGQLRGPRLWQGRSITLDHADRLLNSVLDAGINFIDTAPVYGPSEELIGRFVGHRRHEYWLATKCGRQMQNMGDHDVTPGLWTRDGVLADIDNSLRRLRTDYVDILQFHTPTYDDIMANDLIPVLEQIRAAGKTRFIGVSATQPHLARFLALAVFDTYQIPYSALEWQHDSLITQAAALGGGTIIRGGVAQGAPDKATGTGWDVWQAARLDELLDGLSRMEFMLRYTLSHPAAHTTIVATLNPDHLAANVRAAEAGPLPPDVYAAGRQRIAALAQERA